RVAVVSPAVAAAFDARKHRPAAAHRGHDVPSLRAAFSVVRAARRTEVHFSVADIDPRELPAELQGGSGAREDAARADAAAPWRAGSGCSVRERARASAKASMDAAGVDPQLGASHPAYARAPGGA